LYSIALSINYILNSVILFIFAYTTNL
jgi:hypothetical protein